MEINSIIIRSWENSLLKSRQEIQFSNLFLKKINIFFMPNTSGKSLIFNWLEHLFSFDKDTFIKKTNQDLEVEIQFELNNEEYIYISNYYNSYKVLKNWEEIKNFDKILEWYLWIKWEKLEYYWNKRNSLHSINRFNFLDFSNLWDKETSNEISFINSRYDWISRRFILSYILWAKIDWVFFKSITEYEFKKEFLSKHKDKFEKYYSDLNQISLVDNNIKNLFIELEDYRIIYWDISVAIKELKLLKSDYIIEFWNDENDEDLVFLNNEIKNLEIERESIKNGINKIKSNIKWNELLEKNDLIKSSILANKDLQKYKSYILFKEYLKSVDEIQIQKYLSEKIDPYIKDFKVFMNELYNIFVDKIIEKNLIYKDEIFWKNMIIFNEDTLTIEAFFKTSEWMRKTLRILTFIWLHIFSSKNTNTKCLDYSFYDSFIENIDYNYRNILFDTIFDFIDLNKLEIPKMIFFVTKIEKEWIESSINDLWVKHWKYINIIENNWIK